ncbi:MAG: methyltransferase [Lachnospiraceae bacterium]|nr:methyltransferase [Lachnospiraceae bacterium]
MNLKDNYEKSIHATLISQENDKLKDLLLELKFVLKDEEITQERKQELKKEYGFFDEDASALLSHEEVKVRQFGAFCVASLSGEKAGEAIVDAYLKEDVEYNKEHLLKALSMLPGICGEERLLDRLEILRELLAGERTESHKHYIKEIRQLLGLLRSSGERRFFTGQHLKSEIILTTNRNFREVTLKEIGKLPKKIFNAGVMTICDDLNAIAGIRTFDEMLFVPPFDEELFGSIGSDAEIAARFFREVLTPYILERMRAGDGTKKLPVPFRLDIKGEPEGKKEDTVRTLSELLERESCYNLINLRNDFDIQIRFVLRKSGVLKPLVKFCVPRDKRFSYKTVDIAAGLKPYLAALICKLCSEFMNVNARVIDPFCGAGTLLAERDRCMETEFLFGSDIYPAACAAAEKNLAKAGLSQRSKIINKDFLSLEHRELFNEMITDLPFETEKKTLKDLESIYSVFFSRSESLLEKGSFMFVYTRNSTLFKKQIKKNNVTLIKCHEISKTEGAYLFILKL